MNEKELTHIDLFSGIGGFALAAGWAGFRTIAFCEIEPFCQEILAFKFGAVAYAQGNSVGVNEAESSWWPNDTRPPELVADIRTLNGGRFQGATLLTAGVPCQPASCAGKRRGKEDDRWLWGEAFRVIQESLPDWVVLENPRGIVSLKQGVVFEELLVELEGYGYEARTFIIPACAVNAPHKRMRVWVVGNLANPKSERNGGCPDKERKVQKRILGSRESGRDSMGVQGERCSGESTNINFGETKCLPRMRGNRRDKRQVLQLLRDDKFRFPYPQTEENNWDIPWIEVASRLCSLDDELSPGLVGYLGITEEHLKVRNKNRVQKLKALGNAIVPAVAFQIISAIKEIELGNKTR